jgi:diacylglycerol kinase family enzyme
VLQTEPGAARRYHVIFNPAAGGAQKAGLTTEALENAFRENGLDATVDSDDSASLEERIACAMKSDADIIVAAGGDGTITALAGALAGTDRVLAILPLGTANLLARDLKVPLDYMQAIADFRAMEACAVDVGDVNGQVFLHKLVLGLAPALAAGREKLRDEKGAGALFRFARYFVRTAMRPRRLAVRIATDDGQTKILRVRSIAVANNAYDEGVGMFFCRSCLDSGWLTIYALNRAGLREMARLTFRMLLGRWKNDETLVIERAKAVTLTSRRKMLQVMIDGEVSKMQPPLEFHIRPKALRILAPARAPQEAQAVAEGAAA